MAQRARRWRNTAAAMTAAGVITAGAVAPGAAAAEEPRIDLKVLVVDNGDSPVKAVTAQLRSTGIPYTTVDLNDSGRPVITESFLSDTVNGRPRAKYQGVVLPNEAPFGAGSAEQTALETYERTYGIPQVDAYTWAHPQVGLDYTSEGGWAGTLDGREATVTAAGKAGRFGYLDGAFRFEDNAPGVQESYGYCRPAPRRLHQLRRHPRARRERPRQPRRRIRPRRPPRTRRDLRLQRQPAAVPAAGPGHRRVADPGRAPGADPQLLRGARRRRVRSGQPLGHRTQLHPGRLRLRGRRRRGHHADPHDRSRRRLRRPWQREHGFTMDMVYNAGCGEEWKTEHGGTDAARRPAGRRQGAVPLGQPHLHAPLPGLRPGHLQRAVELREEPRRLARST